MVGIKFPENLHEFIGNESVAYDLTFVNHPLLVVVKHSQVSQIGTTNMRVRTIATPLHIQPDTVRDRLYRKTGI
jgi:hypothetical protein